MHSSREIVITGVGVVSPLGIGVEAFRAGLAARKNCVGPLTIVETAHLSLPFGAEIPDFDPKLYVTPRKSLKVMSRDITTAYAAAGMAMEQAGLAVGAIPPERLGVVFGADMIYSPMSDLEAAFKGCMVDGKYDHSRWGNSAMSNIYPLWMLKYLPNYPACHVGIVHDARGPNNSIIVGDASSLMAFGEAATCIERGMADAMLTGGTGTRLSLVSLMFGVGGKLSQRISDPEHASRPFDKDRDGVIYGEGSAVYLLEAREHAEARGAKILARLAGWASTWEDRRFGRAGTGSGFSSAIDLALRKAELSASDIGHVNAHGESSIETDAAEAKVIRQKFGDVPVLAMKSYFGNLGAGSGAVELLASLLALETGEIPVTLNYETPDPACPVHVVHNRPQVSDKPAFVKVNQSRTGQTAAVIIVAP